jgi:PAS domain S-box-containing protein
MEMPNDIYRQILDSIEDYSVIILDANGKISYSNKGCSLLYDYTAAELLTLQFSSFSENDIQKGLPELLTNEVKNIGNIKRDCIHKKKNGSFVSVTVRLEASRNGSIHEGITMISQLKNSLQPSRGEFIPTIVWLLKMLTPRILARFIQNTRDLI